MIFDIKRFSIHDGPGIRTTVFLKGCPLTCRWCHNPESQSSAVEMIYKKDQCLRCGSCVVSCPQGALSMGAEGVEMDPDRCDLCGLCVQTCYPGARELLGIKMSGDSVMDEVIRDRPFYEESGGGVTFSGGEPFFQPLFLKELLHLAHQHELDTAVDTCGFAPWKNIEALLPGIDLMLYDLKVVEDQNHRIQTGVSNQRIISNLRRLAQSNAEVIIRRPVIPTVNDTRKEMELFKKLLADLPTIRKVDLLPYHDFSAEKYQRLGKQQETKAYQPPTEDHLVHLQEQISSWGYEVSCGG